jgi:hypothetical protein
MLDFLRQLFSPASPHLSREQQRAAQALFVELINIGRKEDYLSETPGGSFTAQCHHRRAREIGERLHQLGGTALMWQAYGRVRRSLGKQLCDHLEYAWTGIGAWMA